MANEWSNTVACNTAGEAVQGIASAFAGKLMDVGTVNIPAFTVELGTFRGFRSIDLLESVGGPTFPIKKFVVLGMAEEELISARELAMQPGFNTTVGCVAPDLERDPEYWTLDQIEASWKDVVVEAKRSIVDLWSVGVPLDASYDRIENDPGKMATFTGWFAISGGAETFITQDVFRVVIQQYGLGPLSTVINPELSMQQPSVMVIGLEALVKAVDAITNQDIEISMNQGAFVWSVKAKVLVTAPGP